MNYAYVGKDPPDGIPYAVVVPDNFPPDSVEINRWAMNAAATALGEDCPCVIIGCHPAGVRALVDAVDFLGLTPAFILDGMLWCPDA